MTKARTTKAAATKAAATKANVWKLRDARARFSALVRKARTGRPQTVTVNGKEAVIVIDADRFEVRLKPVHARAVADLVGASKKYRGLAARSDFERGTAPVIAARREIFDREFFDAEDED